MSWLKGARARLRSVLRPGAADARMEEEFRFHVELEIEKHLRAGLPPAEARRRAMLAFGGLDRHGEAMRDARGLRWLDDLERDVRIGLRGLARAPSFTAVAVLTLALGVGATTAVFSALDAVVLRPLPFAAPERLVEIDDVRIPLRWPGGESFPKGSPDITDLEGLDGVFDGVAAYAPGGLNLSGVGSPRRIQVGVVTPDLFAILGVPPLVGRSFTAEEGQPDGPRVALISEPLWRTGFGADRAALGRSVTLNGRAYDVVGVMPAWFAFPEEAEVWIPLSVPATPATWEPFRQYMPSRIVARLAPGVTAERAGQAVRSLFTPYERADRPITATPETLVRPLRASLTGDHGPMLLVLFGATALVLLVACANIANLLISRAVVRRREVALRAILGASPRRLVRQLLTESTLIGLIGGVLGVLLALAGVRLLDVLIPAPLTGISLVHVDARVLGFALALALGTGLAFGVWPALGARRTNAGEAVKSRSAGGGSSAESARLRRAFVVVQVAMALILVIGSGVMLRSLQALLSERSGVDPERVATLELALAEADYPDRDARLAFYREVLDRLESIPEISAAAAVNELPLRGQGGIRFTVYPEGRPPESTGLDYMAQDLRVTPDYFAALGIPILEGRAPRPRADTLAPPEVAINEELAAMHWPDASPLGARLMAGGDEAFEIVGVVGNVRPGSLESEVIPQAYYSLLDTPYDNAALVARGAIPPRALTRVLRDAVRSVAPRQAVYNVRTMDEVIAGAIAPRRTNTLLITTFGLLALVLAAVGVYGVMAFGVAQRTREIGIRIALGAESRRLLRQVVGEGLGLAAAGTVIGLLGAWMLARVLGGLVYGVAPRDPVAFIAAPAVLLAVAVLAALVPARRAARVDPVEAIRVE